MSALAAAKGTGRGAPLVIAAACLVQASASSLSAIPWWPGTQSRVVLPAHGGHGRGVRVAAFTWRPRQPSSKGTNATDQTSTTPVARTPGPAREMVRQPFFVDDVEGQASALKRLDIPREKDECACRFNVLANKRCVQEEENAKC